MVDVADNFDLLQEEETDYRSALSESFFTRQAGVSNALYNRLNEVFRFKFFGPFRPILGGEDGTFSHIWPWELVGVSGYIRTSGSSGTTSIDLHKITSGSGGSTILASPITIASSAVDGVVFYKNLIDATESIPAGVTVPTISTTDFLPAEQIRADIDGNATGARDLILSLHYRARTP